MTMEGRRGPKGPLGTSPLLEFFEDLFFLFPKIRGVLPGLFFAMRPSTP